jgi:hypothetical protein
MVNYMKNYQKSLSTVFFSAIYLILPFMTYCKSVSAEPTSDCIFFSVGRASTEQQESFIKSVEARLRSEGLEPHTVGRSSFGSSAPLKTISEDLDKCYGAVVLALERYYYPNGFEMHGGNNQKSLSDIRLPTTWNQIEAAMAYSRGHPLLVIVENTLKPEGLLDDKYDWYVQRVKIDNETLSSQEFNGVFSDWKNKVKNGLENKHSYSFLKNNLSKITFDDLLSLNASQIWSIFGAIIALFGGSFSLGRKFERWAMKKYSGNEK